MGDAARVEAFCARFWPDLPAIEDPGRGLYRAFGLERARARALASPRYLLAATRSLLRAGMGRPHGDVMQMPGAFLVRGGELVWRHAFRHFGDHPDLAQVARRAAAH